MQRVYQVTMFRHGYCDHYYNVVAKTAEVAVCKARRQAVRDCGPKREWRCKSLSETGTVVL